jgi:hypothetical protein
VDALAQVGLIVIDVDTQALVTQEARRGPYNDSATLRPMIDAAHAVTPLTRVLADAEFDSELNHQHVRALGATSVIPATRGKATWRRHGVRARMWRRFPRRQYRRRNVIESVFSAIKRKLSTRAPGRSLCMQRRRAFLLGLTFNLYRLRCRPRRSTCRVHFEDVNRAKSFHNDFRAAALESGVGCVVLTDVTEAAHRKSSAAMAGQVTAVVPSLAAYRSME